MPASTTIANDWDIDYTNRILSHIDMVLDYDGRTAGTVPTLGEYVRGSTSGAVGKVIAGTDLGGTNATGSITLTNVLGRFEDGESFKILDEIPFDGVDSAKNGIAVGDSIDGPTTEDFDVYAIEYNYGKQGVTDGTGTLYGIIQVAGFANDEAINNTTSGETSVALVNGSEVDNGTTWDAVVNETTNGTGTPATISGIINYDAGTIDIPNDALVLAGERATGILTYTAQPANNDTVVLGSITYTYKTTLTGASNEVLIGGAEINTMRNLANAVNGGTGEGTTYGNGTSPNTTADICISGALTLEARTFIPSVTTTTSTVTGANHSWTASTLNTGVSGSTGRGRAHTRTLDSVTATGSYLINDIDGAWADNDVVFIDQVVNYDNVQGTEAFAVGDVVKGTTSGAQGRVLAVTSTRLILAEQTLRFEENEQLHRVAIDQSTTYVADIDFATGSLDTDEISAVTVNHPNSQPCPRVAQKQLLQGGIYANSINNVRHVRQLYNFIQDTWDEFDQMDDTVPMSGQVKNAQYTIINNWFIPDLSMRFLDSGSIRDDTSDNIWANPQSLGTMESVTSLGYGAGAVQPQLYIEQDGSYVDPQDVPSLEGHINLLVKIKTNTDTARATSLAGQGESIDNGRIRVYNRFYLHTYSHFFTATNDTGGVVTIALATSNDLNNVTETHDINYTAQSSATAWSLGEEIVTGAGTVADPLAVGVVVSADTSGTGNIQYVLKSGHQFANTDVITNQNIQNTKTAGATVTNVVAGYNDKIGFGHVDSNFTGGTVSGTYQIGESVTQTGTSATGVILEVDGNTLYIDEDEGVGDATWNGTGLITGDLSSATYTPTTRSASTVAPKDIGDEVDNNYACIFGLDKTASGTGRTITNFYEYTKFLTAKESTTLQGGRNQLVDVEGRLYRKVDQADASPTFAEQVDAPYGIKAGDLFIGAQSVFVQDMASADIQNYQLVDESGTTENPPNVQTLEVTGLATGDKVVVYETTAPASTTIKTNQYAVGTVGTPNNESGDSIILIADGADDGTPLGADTPATGTIRIEDPINAGLFLNFVYASRNKTASTFTLETNADQPNGQIGDVTSATNLNATDDVYVTLLSEVADASTESKLIEYVSDINIMTRVRKRGILPFEVTGTFGSGGASIATIRTTDPVVDAV